MFKVHKIKMRKRPKTNFCSRCIDCDFKKFATIETETKKKEKETFHQTVLFVKVKNQDF